LKPGDKEASIRDFFSKVVSMLQDITAIAAVLGICIVGIMYIMSHGDEEKTESAKNYIVSILIGVVLAFTAWAIISLVNLVPGAIEF
jgi:type IV secretory pathway VirB2 component (pilin)